MRIFIIASLKTPKNNKLYDRNVSSIHKNINKNRCTKNEILWNSTISYTYFYLCFYEYLKTFPYTIKIFKMEVCMLHNIGF